MIYQLLVTEFLGKTSDTALERRGQAAGAQTCNRKVASSRPIRTTLDMSLFPWAHNFIHFVWEQTRQLDACVTIELK